MSSIFQVSIDENRLKTKKKKIIKKKKKQKFKKLKK